MADSVFMAELSWPEYQAKVAAGVVLFLPLGATEQHGPHLAMNVDVVLPTAVCEGVARRLGGLVAPTLPYGYKS
jgi:creatinine amidohydrolase